MVHGSTFIVSQAQRLLNVENGRKFKVFWKLGDRSRGAGEDTNRAEPALNRGAGNNEIIRPMRQLLGFVASILACAAAAPPAFRLPNTAHPTRYELELTIVPRQSEFRGKVRVWADVSRRTESIWLNSKGLTIEAVSVEAGGATKQAEFSIFDEFLEVRAGEIGPGPVRLEIAYHGPLNEKINDGIYRRQSGPDWYVYTTFTPIEARRAFPCFDEPGYKARWRVSLHVPQSDTAASNSRIISEVAEAGGMKRVEFAETNPIPSEVVALVVGPFDVVDAGVAGARKVPVRILAPRGRAQEAEAARGSSAEIVARLEEYTGIPYPWDKLDHVAVLDMPYGAVENPGLITYRDRIILSKPARDTAERQRQMRGTMAHELAHQWFGNLVTQAWWDDVWLSEGFATWLGGKTSDLELPVFERSLAAVGSRAQIMREDAGAASRPVRLPMNSRKEMERVYGGIVYQKGAAILGMLEQWIGTEGFERGIRRYLTKHALGNATTDDLAAAIRKESGVEVSAVLHSFLDQAGFPTVRAVGCTFEQAEPKRWILPVCVHGDDGTSQCAVLARDRVPLSSCPAWIWPNRAGSGYFRVELSAEMLESLMKNGWDQLTSPERLSVIADVAAAALPSEAVLKVLPVMARDPQPAVSNAALRLLGRMIVNSAPADREKVDVAAKGILEGTGRRRPPAISKFAGAWEGKVNDLPGVKLTIREDAGKVSGSITFYFQTKGDDGKWRVVEGGDASAAILAPKIEGTRLTFEVPHHKQHGGTEYGPNKRYSVYLTGDDEVRLRDRDDPKSGQGFKMTRAK